MKRVRSHFLLPRTAKRVVASFLLWMSVGHLFTYQAEAAWRQQTNRQIVRDLKGLFQSQQPLSQTDLSSLAKLISFLPASHYRPLRRIELSDRFAHRRGAANDHMIVINQRQIESIEELASVLIHELGHVVDLGVLRGRTGKASPFSNEGSPIPASDPSTDFYRISWQRSEQPRSDATTADFVSQYAQESVFEDFAESYLFYFLHGKRFAQLRKLNNKIDQKYTFLRRRVFRNQTYDFASSEPASDQKQVFDATLLQFDLSKLLAFLEDREEERSTVSRMRYSGRARYTRVRG